jgi:hypothetical protein
MLIYILFLSFKWNNTSKTTFNIIEKNKLIQKDLTGDKKKDIMYINCENDKYYVQINTENKSLQLNPNKKIGTIGNHYSYWPIRLSLKDISNDGVPEIFLQTCYNNKALQHIFLWKDKNFENIYYNHNNILGFIDTTKDKKAKCIVGNFFNNKMKFNTYILVEDKIEKINYFYTKNFMGKDTISAVINSIEKKMKINSYYSLNIFNSLIKTEDIELLEKFINTSTIFKFQDAFFCDLAYSDYNTISSVKWILNFKGSSKDFVKNYTFEIILKSQQNDNLKYENLKIYSINYK